MKTIVGVLGLVLAFTLSACGGGGGGATASTSTTAATTVTVSGTLSDTAGKPSLDGNSASYAVGDWSGATVEIIDSKGTVIGTATADKTGSFSVKLAPGANYTIRAVKGNLVLKAFVEKVESATTPAPVKVDPTSTAVVKVLAATLGVADIGEKGTDVTVKIATVTVSTAITEIKKNANLASIATVASVATVAPATAVPGAPTGVSVTAGNAQTTIGWTAVSGATSYNVYYRTSTGVTTANGTKVAGIASGVVITVADLLYYYIIVTAVNAAGESIASVEVIGVNT